jgi:calcium-dependent protein kinase
VVGTPYYVAPEVLSQSYDYRCDIWSLGVILFIILCGYPPFNGKTSREVIQKIKKGDVEFEHEDWQFVSKEA